MNNKLIIISVGLALVVGGIAVLLPDAQAIILDNPQTILWVKPITDTQWAEDVKVENFDIKSTPVLKEMIESHTEKLAREEDAYIKYQECPQCILYEVKEHLRNTYPNMTAAEVDADATKQADIETNQRLQSIEKLKQSIERMNHEVDLRWKGAVVTNLDDTGKPRKENELTGKTVRIIND